MKKICIALLLLLLLNQHITAQCSGAPNSVPYLETFNGITANDQLPTCWVASSMGSSCHTYLSYLCAGFYNYPTGNSSFYSPAIHLNAGTVYSASITYSTSSGGSGTSWAQLSLLLSPYANSSNNVSLASIYAVSAPAATVLSNTFTVSSSGSYELIIRVTSTIGNITNLYFDDVSVTAPCSLNPFSVSVSGPTVACQGETSTLTASGASSYTWTTSQGTIYSPSIAVSPTASTTYTLIGMNNQCADTIAYTFSVNPHTVPSVSISSSDSTICAGETVTLTASGASTYVWQNGSNQQQFVVAPGTSTTYSVTGTSNGCTNTSVFMENVSTCDGIKREAIYENSIYPNPGNGLYTLMLNGASSVSINITDAIGRVVYTTVATGNTILNLSGFANGLYYAKLQWPGHSDVVKLIKQ